MNFSKRRYLKFKFCLALAPPPPPVNVTQSNITMTTVSVRWSIPADSEPFRITNYSIQYKKAGTKMSYYNALTVRSDIREGVVENLDLNTKYLLRVLSINAYGSAPSKVVVFKTKGKWKVNSVKVSLDDKRSSHVIYDLYSLQVHGVSTLRSTQRFA